MAPRSLPTLAHGHDAMHDVDSAAPGWQRGATGRGRAGLARAGPAGDVVTMLVTRWAGRGLAADA